MMEAIRLHCIGGASCR